MNVPVSSRSNEILNRKILMVSRDLLIVALDYVSIRNYENAKELFLKIKTYGVYQKVASLGISICEATARNIESAERELHEAQTGKSSNLHLPDRIISIFPSLDPEQHLWLIYLFLRLQPCENPKEVHQSVLRDIQSKFSSNADQKLTRLLETMSSILLVRIGKVYNPQIIGNFSNATDIYLRKLQGEPTQNCLDIFLAENPPINVQLMKMFRRKMHIVEDPFLLDLFENSEIFKQSGHYLAGLTNYSNEFEIYNRTKPAITFTADEELHGQSLLEQLGISSSDWFVCIFSRDPAFKKAQYPEHDFATETHRNSDINKMGKAIAYIIEKGGFVVRMGSIVAQQLEFTHARLIDYPLLPLRNDFLDVYLAAKCRFFLGTTSGICDLSIVFDVPNLRVNFIPPGGAPWGKNCLFIPKKIRSRFTGKYITYPELLNHFMATTPTLWNGTTQYKSLGYMYEENDEDEILAVTKEMFQRLEGTYLETEEDRVIQQQYQKLLVPGHWSYGNKTPMGLDFIKKNKELFRTDNHSEASMNILIILPKYSNDPFEYYDFPIGLAYISATLKHQGYHVDVMDLNEYYAPIGTNNWAPLEMLLRRQCASKKYDIVCTGGLSPFFDAVKAIVSIIKSIDSAIVTIIGGGLVSSEPELIMEAIKADFGVIGEGEETIVELVANIQKAQSHSDIKGIVYLDPSGHARVTSPRAALEDINSLPFPDYSGFNIAKIMSNTLPADLHGYYFSDEPRVIPIVTSRSCPFKCTFCFHPIGNKYRQRSIDSIMSEVEYLITTYNINMIIILDELFGYNKSWLMEFCQRIRAFGIKWGAQMHLSQVSEDVLATMRESGCIYLSYGLESASPTVLKSMKKQLVVEQMATGLEATYRAGIQIQGNFIFGDVAENLETINETLGWWTQNKKYMINLGRIIPFPGSELWHQAVNNGLIKDKLSHIVNGCGALYCLNLSQLSQNDFHRFSSHLGFISDMIDRLPGRMISCHKTGFNYQKGDLYSIVVMCPHCHSTSHYNKIHNAHIKNLLGNFHSRYGCKHCNQRFDMLLPTIEEKISLAINENMAQKIAILGANSRAEMLLIGSPVLLERTQFIIDDGRSSSNSTHLMNIPIISKTATNIEDIMSGIDTLLLTCEYTDGTLHDVIRRLTESGINECRPFSEIDNSLVSINLLQNDEQRIQHLIDNFLLGVHYLEQARHDEAFKIFLDIANIAPHDIETHVKLATAALALHDYTTALHALYTADMLRPGDPKILDIILNILHTSQHNS